MRNIIQKEGIVIILITKSEMLALKKLGYKFGSESMDGVLHRTYSKHKTYFLTEEENVMRDLNKIRQSRIVETHIG